MTFRARSVVVAVVAALLVAACGWARPDVPPSTARCDLGRGNDQDVIGHDLAASTRLPDGRVLFVFGDTLVGTSEGDTREVAGLVNSSAAVLPAGADICDPALEYLTNEKGRVRGLLPRPPKKGSVYWPVDVAAVGDLVWMLFRWIEPTGDGPLELRILGTGLAVARSDELVFRKSRSLLVRGDDRLPSALAADGDALRTLLCDDDDGPCRLGTIDTESHDLRTAEGPAIDDGATEMSLGRVGGPSGAWRAAVMSGLRCRLQILTPPPPGEGGSWRSRTVLAPNPGRRSLCYAGRVHEMFSTEDRLVATWVDTAVPLEDNDEYWPHVVEIDLSE